jgi:hypothetical protein
MYNGVVALLNNFSKVAPLVIGSKSRACTLCMKIHEMLHTPNPKDSSYIYSIRSCRLATTLVVSSLTLHFCVFCLGQMLLPLSHANMAVQVRGTIVMDGTDSGVLKTTRPVAPFCSSPLVTLSTRLNFWKTPDSRSKSVLMIAYALAPCNHGQSELYVVWVERSGSGPSHEEPKPSTLNKITSFSYNYLAAEACVAGFYVVA